jgi:hypothetical protein
MPAVTAGFDLAARYSQIENVNSLFANAKSSILQMAFCKNNVLKAQFSLLNDRF